MAEKWHDNILEAIGGTPLVYLKNLSPKTGGHIFAKVEFLNPGGSIKSRTALCMINAAESKGLLNRDSIIVEATSGNQGIALAMIGAVKGYKVKIIMPENMSLERRKLIQAYGAEIILTPAGSNIQEAIEGALDLAMKMAKNDERIFLPRQFANPDNPEAHRNTTGLEIISQMGCKIDAFVAGFGTGGTLTGVGEVIRSNYPEAKIIAAEPQNAAILSGGSIGHHVQQGIGDGVIPPILNRSIIDDTLLVSDEEAISVTHELARQEGLLCGISSGTNVCAAIKTAAILGPNTNIVTVLPDTGERYLSTELYE